MRYAYHSLYGYFELSELTITTRVLSLNLYAMHIDDDDLPTPKAKSGTLHPPDKLHDSPKGKAPAHALPSAPSAPPANLPSLDSDEWEETPMPSGRPAFSTGLATRGTPRPRIPEKNLG